MAPSCCAPAVIALDAVEGAVLICDAKVEVLFGLCKFLGIFLMDNFWEWTGVDGSEREWLRCRGGDDEARGGRF